MTHFAISAGANVNGFNQHITIDLLAPIETQLKRQRLSNRVNQLNGDKFALHSVISENASLRINFGWSFESSVMYERMMYECLTSISPYQGVGMGTLVSDNCCSWLGFLPLNIFDRAAYECLSVEGLIAANNNLIDFQIAVVTFIANYPLYKQHSIARNNYYRFNYFKALRKDEVGLEDAYWQYIDAMKNTSTIMQVPLEVLEENLGCHFLHYPNLFFELVAFTKLRGELHE